MSIEELGKAKYYQWIKDATYTDTPERRKIWVAAWNQAWEAACDACLEASRKIVSDFNRER